MSSTTTKILLVEDNPGDARLIQEMLAESAGAGFEIEWVPQLSAGLERLSQGKIDLVLLDLGLSDSRGLETFVRAYNQAPQIPFVVLTGLDDETLALSAVRQGAQDYLVKGQTDGHLLLRAIRYATERKRIEEELRLANEELRREIEVRGAAELAVEAERQRLYALLDGLPAFVSLIGPDFSLLFGNRVFEETFGSWQGKHCYEAIFGRETACEDCEAVQVLENRTLSIKEMTVPGKGRVYNIYKYPFTERDGSTLVLSLGIDITQRKRAEEALEAERQRLYSLLDGLPGLVYLKAPDYSLRFANRLFREICGDWEGKKCFEAMFKREAPCERCTQFRVLETGQPSVKEATFAETKRTYQVYSYPFADVDGTSLVLTLGIDISERKQAEREVERLASFPELNPHPVFEVNGEGTLTYYNAATSKTLAELGVEGDGKLFLPEDYEIILQAIRGTESRKFYREVQINGAIFEEYIDVIPRFDVARFRAYNITARKRAEEKLRQSQARLAKAQRLAHLGNWEWDLQSQELHWSEEVYRIFGLDPQEFTPTLDSLMKYVHPADRERVSHGLNDALLGVKPYNLVSRLVRPDGSVRYVHLQAEAVFEDGKARRMLGTAQDITERRIAQMRLRESEERFRAIFEAAAIGIGLTDMKGRFVTVNKTFQEMLGYSEEEIRGKTCLNLTHEKDLEMSRELFRELESSGQPHFQMEKRFCRRDGQYFWGRVTVSLVKGFDGQPVYTIGMVEDITQAKEAEKRLQESENRLRILASQLMTAQEDERKRISQELHDELGQSLLVLKLQARYIEKTLGQEQQQLRQECQEMLVNFDKTVENVRRLSRDLSPTIIDDLGLSVALQHLISEFSKHYHIECRTQEINIDDLFPLATQIVIYRIFQESLTNIGKHSQADLLQISIDKSDQRVSFLIQDSGQGFDPAKQLSQRRGMGLASMEERARMVGGTLSIWSQEGAGTKISLVIPYSAEPE